MAGVFTDEQIQAERDAGHPVADLMELINQHTNHLGYAETNLSYLLKLVQQNQADYRERRRALLATVREKQDEG